MTLERTFARLVPTPAVKLWPTITFARRLVAQFWRRQVFAAFETITSRFNRLCSTAVGTTSWSSARMTLPARLEFLASYWTGCRSQLMAQARFEVC
ncbi:hypothetical protein CGCSCA1_v010432 [Colletotrichum siamense]|nr:hypothetical protein CGCSCA1_v010432 [Colletotrichum siamense]